MNKSEPIHVVIMGVSGSGKTTVAAILQDRWGWELAEADEFHPQSNIDKMHAGIPLTDDDRWPWLELIREWMTEQEAHGRPTIVTCSALKRSYRDVLRRGSARVVFMHLDGDRALLSDRLSARMDHFMPASLLDSQYATLEDLRPDELGAVVDIAGTPAGIASDIERKLEALTRQSHVGVPDGMARANVGVYGLGVMGSALARNLASKGLRTAVTNIDSAYTDRFVLAHGEEGEFVVTKSPAEFVASLERPRKVLLMVTAGPAVDSVLGELSAYLESGDIVVDMGNSHFRDTRRREATMRQRGLYFVGCGTSGGEEGALTGPALMIGGARAPYEQLQPIFETIAARADDGASCAKYVGPDGAGHFAKTLHNGIEYAQMQAIAEVYHLLHNTLGLSNAQVADVFDEWDAEELNSYLLQISAALLRYSHEGSDFIELVADRAGNKGTGAWSTMIGVELGADVSMLAGSLFARFASGSSIRGAWPDVAEGRSDDSSGSNAGRTLVGEASELTVEGNGLTVEDLRHALWLCGLVTYAQGFEVIRRASQVFDWKIDLADVCRGWRAGCIIRGAMLEEFASVLEGGNPLDIVVKNADTIEQRLASVRNVVSTAVRAGVPLAATNTALNYVESARARRLPAALIQAQRDFFGAHGFEMIDREGGGFHGPWHGQLG
ncbi:NADP-dependent phosphogluconate dehydrogenase [Trueperella pecoris]|uniref:6-phosphogluconate dehydrogenase, decarboxylating n=1 Tax=Trueperella pecoris TaxID=2733571 RepID=A0A7M1QVS4_9ACTO|nr:NADP-dependent phosphogluconate dehydrogenase [Trueperella pecoris]QOR45933.1 NADP-dependent phosphogluconate dehydrogenase [Trueperella pecoris]QTG75762.1 NADP-dependent phosphogluconate dehydrogenase [Trueperella pecoris]